MAHRHGDLPLPLRSRAYRRTRERLGEVTASLQEDISGVRVVQAFRREPANYRRFQEVNGSYRDANVDTVNIAPSTSRSSACCRRWRWRSCSATAECA